MDCSLPGSYVHGILQARIPEWVAIAFSKGSSGPRDRTWVSCIEGRFFTFWGTREAQEQIRLNQKKAHQSEYSAYQVSITWGSRGSSLLKRPGLLLVCEYVAAVGLGRCWDFSESL